VLWLIIVFASSEPPPGTFATNTVSLLGIFIPDLIPQLPDTPYFVVFRQSVGRAERDAALDAGNGKVETKPSMAKKPDEQRAASPVTRRDIGRVIGKYWK
jgi:hypothetical protein